MKFKLVLILTACGYVSAAAEDRGETNPPVISVNGVGVVDAAPDTFKLSASVIDRGRTSEQALAFVASRFEKAKAALGELEGLQTLQIDASDASVVTLRDPDCIDRADDEAACEVIGYSADISLRISGSPAQKAGAALAMLVESGVGDVSLSGYSIAEAAARRKEALALAVADARSKAETIAMAGGARLGRIRRIQYGAAISDAREADEIIVTASRVRQPKVKLNLDPQPIEIKAEVAAEFEVN